MYNYIMKFFLIKIKKIILDVLFPPVCLNCQKYLSSGEFICNGCYKLIKLNSAMFCPICKSRLADNKKICNHSKKNLPYFYLLAAAGNYDDPVLRNLIHGLKYRYLKNSSSLLGKILLRYIENCKLKIENFVIIPIPLHSARQRQRGFNQSKLIAEFIAEKFNLPLIEALKKIKNNKPQVGLKGNEERIENVKNCFIVQNPASIEKKNILLVDDVFTSGATMNEAIKILKENGARRIIAAVAAKA